MKNIKLTLGLILFSLFANAQTYTVFISGMVTDSLKNPTANFSLMLAVDSMSGGYTNQVTTNSSGYFEDSFHTTSQQGTYQLIYVDCHRDTIIVRGFFSANYNRDFKNLISCPNKSGNGGGGGIPSKFYLTGTISASNTFATDAVVYLIGVDSGNYLYAIDSTIIRQGVYVFSDLDSGKEYYLKAALLPSSSDYSSYMPTYYKQALLWKNADKIVLNSSMKGVDIQLIKGNNPGGPGFISGYVSQGANKKGPGDPVPNVLVLLLNENDEPVDFDYTDAEGKYEFDQVALGSYKIYVDIAGKESESYNVVLDGENSEKENLDFKVNSETVTKNSVTTGIKETQLNSAKIYPNPVKDQVELNLKIKSATTLKITVISISGKEVINQNFPVTKGDLQYKMDISTLDAGVYLMNIKSDRQSVTLPIMKN